MKLTTIGRFAVTAMVDLGLQPAGEPVTLSEIGARQKNSLSYLEQLSSEVRRGALVNSTRDLWARLNDHNLAFLASYSLKRLLDNERANQDGALSMGEMKDPVHRRDPELISD